MRSGMLPVRTETSLNASHYQTARGVSEADPTTSLLAESALVVGVKQIATVAT